MFLMNILCYRNKNNLNDKQVARYQLSKSSTFQVLICLFSIV